VPKNRGKKNLTLIASMSVYGMGESMCIEGATDAKAFEVYIEHFLAPSLCEGQVVVMDNLGAHQPKRIRALSSKPEEPSWWCCCPPTLRI
jgi:transposase